MAKRIRTFNMSGKIGSGTSGTPTHHRLSIGHMKTDKVYAVESFRVYPSVTNVNSQINGTLTLTRDDNIEPKNPNFSDTNQYAWSSYNIHAPVPPGVTESFTISQSSHVDDEKYFKMDLHLHVVDENSAGDINYFVKITEYDAPPAVDSIVQLDQFGELLKNE